MKLAKLLQSVFGVCLGLGVTPICPFAAHAQPVNQTFQQRVAQKANDEWVNFNAPNRPVVQSSADVALLEKAPLEYSKCLTVDRYWAAVPASGSKPLNGNTCAFNTPPTPQGKGQVNQWNRFPWSAAFVSFIMNASGAGTSFKYSGRHAVYIVDAVKNKNNPNHPFRGYPIDQVKPEIGDLICAPRGENKSLTYAQIVKTGDFQSHCDIVVAKKANNTIEVVGGNVGDTVAKTIVALNSKGFIRVTNPAFRPWFVVIKNSARP